MKDIVEDIYAYVTARGIETGSHGSDLYIPVNATTEDLVKRYKYSNNVTTFTNQITKTRWYEVPFAYSPFWEAKIKQASVRERAMASKLGS